MRHEDPLGIDHRYGLWGELSWSADEFHKPIKTPAQAINQRSIPGAAGEQQQGARLGGRCVAHQLRVMPRARVMKLSCSLW
jgi:hypothetical protein